MSIVEKLNRWLKREDCYYNKLNNNKAYINKNGKCCGYGFNEDLCKNCKYK